MFRTAELQRKLPKEDYREQVPRLREELLTAQMELRKADFPVVVVFAGVDGAGKGETVNQLHEWLDSRWLITRAFGEHIHDRAWMTDYFRRHDEAVRREIAPERLLVYQAGQGWEPLCAFLGVPVPAEPYPSENNTAEFQARVAARNS